MEEHSELSMEPLSAARMATNPLTEKSKDCAKLRGGMQVSRRSREVPRHVRGVRAAGSTTGTAAAVRGPGRLHQSVVQRTLDAGLQ